MNVDFGKAITNAWKYSTNLKRLAVFTIIFLIAAALIIVPLILSFRSFAGASLLGIIQSLGWLFLGFVIAVLISTYATLVFTHNYANQKSLSGSLRYARSRYLRFLVAIILISIISAIVMIVPILGIIFAIIAGLIFYYVRQEIAVSDSSLSDSFSNSYRLFRGNILDTIISVVLSVILSLVMGIIFFIPLLIAGFSIIATALQTGFMQAIMANIPVFVVTGIIFIIGLVFAMLFLNSMATDVYMQLKKKKR